MKTTLIRTGRFLDNFVLSSQRNFFCLQGKLKFALLMTLFMCLFNTTTAFGQIALRSTSSITTTTTALNIPKPANLAIGDVMIAQVLQSGSDFSNLSDATGPAGWTEFSATNMNSSNNRYRATAFYKVANATDVSAATFNFTFDSDSDDGEGAIIAFSGVDTSVVFDVLPATSYAVGSDSTLSPATVTTANANAAVVMLGIMQNDVTVSTYTSSNPASYTEIYDLPFNATLDMGMAAAWATRTTAGATGAGTGNLSASAGNGAIFFALRRFTGTITTGAVSTPICAGSSISVPYTKTGTYAAGNVFTAQLSDAAGSFTTPTDIGTLASVNNGSITATIPVGQAAGTGYRIRVVSSLSQATGTDNGANLTIGSLPTAVAGANFSGCNTGAAISITAGSSATNNSGVTWSSNGTGTINNPNSLTLATYTPGIGESGNVTITLTSHTTGVCPDATSNKTLAIAAVPTASAGGNSIICVGQTATVSGASSSNGTISWSENGAGSITAGGTTLTPTYTPAAADAGNTVTLTMTVTNSPCTNATATYTVQVIGAATANAGTAVVACEDAGAVNITAGATSTNNNGVLWTSNGTGTFTNDTSLTLATYEPSAADIALGSVTLTLTATGNSPCSNVSSNKTFTIHKVPTAAAGGSTTVCVNQTATVSGASSSNGTISWSENGAGSITAGGTTLTPTYTPAAGDAGNTVTLTMTVSNAPCAAATATYTVDVIGAATANAGTAVVTCANSGAVNITAGSSAGNNTGVTWTSSGTGSFTDANSLTTAIYTPSAADILAGSVTLTLTATGNTPCGNVSSNKTLTIRPVPVATGVVICQGQPSVAMTSSTVCPLASSVAAGPSMPGTAVNATGVGSTAWSNPGNITTAGSPYATVNTSFSISNYLRATGYGFAIPAGSVINGIQLAINRQASSTSFGVTDDTVQLLKAGTIVGTDKASGTTWPTAMTVANYGGVADLWGTTWTASDINNANFGVVLAVGSLASRTSTVDYMRITVTYQPPGDLNWYTVSSGGSAIGTGSSFNPVGVAGSGLTDTNTPGTTSYYVECSTAAGCRTQVDYVINALPTVSFTGLAASYCEDAAAVTLTGNHPTGIFTGAGITDNGDGTASFDPSVVAVGPHQITYTYTDGNNCPNSDIQTVTILQNVTYYADADNDGFGNAAVSQVSCTGAPAGFVADNTDCNDNDNTIHAMFSFFADNDGDTYGAGSLVSVCAVDANTPPAGYSLDGTDCNDNNNAIHATFDFYADNDGDAYGAGSLVSVCAVDANTPPAGYSLDGTDCDDNNNAIHETFLFYTDGDNDGYGAGVQVSACAVDANTPPAGYSLVNTDCDDANAAIFQSGTLYVDVDGDGYSNGVTQVVCYGATVPAGYVIANTDIDCNDAVAAINPGHIEVLYNGVDDNCDGNLDEGNQLITALLAGSCGSTLTSIGSLIGIQTVGGHNITGYRIRVTNGAEVQVIEKNVPHFTMPQFASYAYATTYSCDIELQRNGIWLGYYGPTCQVSTPAILEEGGAASVSPSQCGATLSTINSLIATTSIQGVSGYRFRVTNLTDPLGPQATQIIDRSQNWFSLQMLTRYNYGTTYRIEVAVKTTGGFGGFGSPCEVSSPLAPSLINCSATIAAMDSRVAATSVSGATQYRFQIVRLSDNASATIDRNVNYFYFNSIPPAAFSPGVLYSVRCAVMTKGTWSPFGDACEITSPGAAAKGATASAQDRDDLTAFRATAYPNPFTSDFNVGVTTSANDDVQVKVYDMMGKLIEFREIKVSELDMAKVGAQYPSGVYNVIVSQDGLVRTLRVIKR